MPCGSYNFVIESNVDMPAMLKEASATGVLLIAASVNTRRNDCHPFIYVRHALFLCGFHSGRPGVQPGKKSARESDQEKRKQVGE